ncbi:flagellar protein FlgN [Natranaerobius thermophilus]|uniref:FlgN family protein n=1 Tax=Natranaerobius thermophilus (strain ATCC BAA-1301 / DSM 18059 / JW/NM-WN-LF) TaxID=457570 RepID=B2A835_NATTJ|nr:flagellar protein FlgN [Natranaerobius thermophilus]ACB85803.1 hypothetical protein Nther_2237 [Natranaerobius thermophilus JW/NM-WN-LF]
MDKLLQDLCENLEEQLATYKLLVQQEEEKQEALIQGELSQLEELIKKEQKIVFQNGELERKRQEIIAQLAEELGEVQDDLTISKLIEYAEGELEKRLSQVYRELEEIVITLKDLNIKNNSLIQQSLSYINYSLDIVAGAGQDDPGTYGNDVGDDSGKAAKKSNRSFLDKKI